MVSWRSGIAIGCLVVACNAPSAAGSGDDGGDPSQGPDDAAGDADCKQPGALACGNTLAAMCSRIVQCCTSAGAPQCEPWAMVVETCKAQWEVQGYDCSTAKFADRTVCAHQTVACDNDLPTVSCYDVYAATSNWPASCVSFWSQFP